MRIYICVDDTDDLTKSTSTGKIADMIAQEIVKMGGTMDKGITRHQLLLHDEPGLLSQILGVFAVAKANIITINSIVPTNGTAVVTISAETMDLTVSLEELLQQLSATHGVVKAEVLAG